jgi:hypothetical protein
MTLSHNAAIFIHAFNHRLGSIWRDLLRKSQRFPKVMVGMGRPIAIIAFPTDSVISLTKLDHRQEGTASCPWNLESDSISAFVY